MAKDKSNQIFVDGDKYEWENQSISGSDLRALAGIPDSAQIFLHIPGKPDQEILNDTSVDLEARNGPEKFSTQSTGSQAG